MFAYLNNLIIYPIKLILEFCFSFFNEIVSNNGFSIILLSFVVTLLTLPIYMIAESWTEKERLITSAMEARLKRIKNAFNGDERYLMQAEYYRLNNYHPIFALRSSLSILIQVPFFLAAYQFLSHLDALQGTSFLIFKDLGKPDELFSIGSFAINILPILMTLINCISGYIYSKGHPLREKIQIYGCATLFLVILYNSPSGLVIYWTMNNVLSLVKNVFYKLKNPKKVLYILLCTVAFIFLITGIVLKIKLVYKSILIVFAILLPLLPFIVKNYNQFIDSNFSNFEKEDKLRFSVFFLSAIGISFLTGFVIPSTIIQSEPENFCYILYIDSPFFYLKHCFTQAMGLFLVWPFIFYCLFGIRVKKTLAVFSPAFLILAVINTFLFSGNYGPLEPTMIFMMSQIISFSLKELIFNTLCVLFIFVILFFIYKKIPKVTTYISLILCLVSLFIGIKNCSEINKQFINLTTQEKIESIEPVYHLSKTEKNVLVIMQDRYFAPMIPYVFEERQELNEHFDGFTYYKNTISLGRMTMFGTPGIFGGYDYSPFQTNKDTSKTVQQKHNEALLSMPILFNKEGYEVTVSDLPYENFSEQPVTSMYEPYPFINRVQCRGVYNDIWYKQNNIVRSDIKIHKIKRNLLCFSIFKIACPEFRRFIYHREYWSSFDTFDEFDAFINDYSSLSYYPELFDTNTDKPQFIMIDNETSHAPIMLSYPDYKPAKKIETFGNGKFAKEPQYHAVMASSLKLADFFDYLKEAGVYDNTRIIIVSDHGIAIPCGEFNNNCGFPFTKENYTAALFVKDFNQRGIMKIDNSFMCNADTPYLATKDLIPNAKNPFTNKPFYKENKEKWIQFPYNTPISTRHRKEIKFPVGDDEWFTVKDDIYIDSNWTKYTLTEEDKIGR